MRILAAAVALAFAPPAAAQDITVAAGVTRGLDARGTTYGWLVSYSHDIAPHLSAAYTYRNEGHIPSHHRDGHSVQLWVSTNDDDGFALRAGAGPYRYFDTAIAENPFGFANAHGWAGLYSLAATWRPPRSRWAWELRADRINAHDSFDTTQLLLGAMYELDQDASFRRNAAPRPLGARDNELALMAGQTIANSFESEEASSRLVEYRRTLKPAIRATIGFLSEGDARLIRRNGIVAQAWLEPSFSADRFTFGVGFGPYFAIDRARAGRSRLLGMIGTTASYHFAQTWTARISWNRVSSNYDRDSDIITAGIGYRF